MASFIPNTMQAVQVSEYRKPYQLNTVPVPKNLAPNDLLVKIAVASYCHSDSMVSEGILQSKKLPLTAAHEGSGTVVAVGQQVAADKSFRVGERVMCGIFYGSCGHCAACTTGPECQRQYCTGGFEGNCGFFGTDGFFAEYARVDARWTTHLPDAVSLQLAAPLACAGRTIWRGVQTAIRLGGLEKGDWLAIVGSGGGLGHIGIQFARSAGLRVIGIDARDEALQVTHTAGADVVLDARSGTAAVVEAVKKATGLAGGSGGAGAALALSDAMEASALASAVTRNHGTVVQMAQPTNVVVPFHELIMRDIRLVGSMLASVNESKAMVEFIGQHGLHIQMETFDGLDKIEHLVERVHSGKIKGKAAIIVDAQQLLGEEQRNGERSKF